jgi:hypothetical protein
MINSNPSRYIIEWERKASLRKGTDDGTNHHAHQIEADRYGPGPSRLGVLVWRDAEYGHSVFQITVHPPGRIYDNIVWSIGDRDLALIGNNDVNEWWNRMAEAIMARVDRENLLITLPEQLGRLPTQSYKVAREGSKRDSRP